MNYNSGSTKAALLFVRLPHGAHEQQAMDILARYSTTDVKVYEVPIKAGEPVVAD